MDITVIWAFLIATAVFLYVVLDGFDLGVGILFPALARGGQRDTAMNSVAPVWDGNETWLVLGGGGLFAAFPLAYAIIMPALYAPIIAMLLGLVLRGVSFEFRWRDPRHERFWDFAFAGGSLVAALAQGIALGALLQGIPVEGRAYAGGWWDWLSPFSLLTGVSVAAGYALLGACWLVTKTEGNLRDRALALARPLALVTVGAIVAVSAATPFLQYAYFERWLQAPGIFYVAPVPVLVAVLTVLLWRALGRARKWGGHDTAPFVLALGLFALTFVGLGISMWPYIIPDSVTIWQAATERRSQVFMLVGIGVMLPIILAYTGYAYWVFRGKVRGGGYHS
jgi:cytochrome d ubiquinol oxidase subunit II